LQAITHFCAALVRSGAHGPAISIALKNKIYTKWKAPSRGKVTDLENVASEARLAK